MKDETLTEEQRAEQVAQEREKLQHENVALRAQFNARLKEHQAEEAAALDAANPKNLTADAIAFIEPRMAVGLSREMALSVYKQQRAYDAVLQRAASDRVSCTASRAAKQVGRRVCGPFLEQWELTPEVRAGLEEVVEQVKEAKAAVVAFEERRSALEAKKNRLLARVQSFEHGAGGIDPLAPDAEKQLISKQQVEGMFALVAQQLDSAADKQRPARMNLARMLCRFGIAIRPLLAQVHEDLMDLGPKVLAPYFLDPGHARQIIGQSDAAGFIVMLMSNPPWGRNSESSIDEADEVLRLLDGILAGRIPFGFDCSKQFEAKVKAEVKDGLVVNGELIPLEGGKRRKHDGIAPEDLNIDVAAHSLPGEPS